MCPYISISFQIAVAKKRIKDNETLLPYLTSLILYSL
nr:MAG TPA: hypothetical protein [Caudoviricetes sp.]